MKKKQSNQQKIDLAEKKVSSNVIVVRARNDNGKLFLCFCLELI